MATTTPESILGTGRRFIESRILLTAAELGVFDALAEKPHTGSEAAHRLDATERGIVILLDALAAMGLLTKEGDRYSCPPDIARFLTSASPASVLPMLKHSAALWRRWSDLTAIVRRGSGKTMPSIYESDEVDAEAFIMAMHVVASMTAPAIVAAAAAGNAKKLLDIGGATGTYSQAFLEASPGMTATVFDLPQVIQIAEKRLAGTRVCDRIALVPGDFYLDELPAGHDLALLSAIIHQNSMEQNGALFAKIFRALAPGGRLLIRDHVMEPDRTSPAAGALFAVNMLVGTPGGGTYTYEELRDSLESAGFAGVRLIQAGERMDGLVEGFKPV
jgi:predicted O-methyltransferase YrrM